MIIIMDFIKNNNLKAKIEASLESEELIYTKEMVDVLTSKRKTRYHDAKCLSKALPQIDYSENGELSDCSYESMDELDCSEMLNVVSN